MPRSGEPARQRLQQAAVELFCERGYDQTTTAEIAARAGVTERTFFRHFPDKREVLFDGQAILRELLTVAIAKAPVTLQPLEVLYRAFRSVERLLGGQPALFRPAPAGDRRHPCAPGAGTGESGGALAEALALALRQRGVDEPLAALAAQAGMATFRYAVASWFANPTGGLGTHLDRAFDELDGLASSFSTKKARRR